jgi:uncharacterized SAM-binding protein YcdF (DUF218 family)
MSLRNLIVPPMSFALLALLGLMIGLARPNRGRFVIWFAVLGLIVLAMPIVGSMLLVALERDMPLAPPPDAPPQAIVILSGNLTDTGGEAPGVDIGPSTLGRVRAGAALARRTGLPVLVSGGSMRDDEPSLASLMARSVREDFRIQARWTEDRSRDTWENARFSNEILHDAGIRSIYLVTDGWHMRRALESFAATGLTVTAVPTALDRVLPLRPGDFIPSMAGWDLSYLALHEWIGRAWYALR